MNNRIKLKNETKKAGFELIVVSFIVLFQELTLIRWISSQVRVISYFPNLILISAFLGLGLGCLRSNKKSLLWLWPILLFFLTLICYFMSNIIFTSEGVNEHLWLLYYDLPKSAMSIPSIKIPICISFIFCSLSFIPLGQFIGKKIQLFKNNSMPLVGYIYNIIGSLLGVIAFTFVGFSGLFPVYWYIIFLFLGLILFLNNKNKLIVYLIFSFLIIFTVNKSEKAKSYSPYYSLSYKDKGNMFELLTNGSLHQIALNFSDKEEVQNEYIKIAQEGYSYPYSLLKKELNHVLILGAGTGNDVATLLKYGKVKHIDVVEIDPVILEWGKKYHPNKPYLSEKVNLINTDARSFLNNTNKTYDLIVFGTLDSQTRLSALSNVRLDNYVYTLEAIKSAKNHLSPDGGVVMYFMVVKKYIYEKLLALHIEAFGKYPFVYTRNHKLFNVILMSGKLFEKHKSNMRLKFENEYIKKIFPFIDIPSDNWPFLYLKDKEINKFYIHIILIILFISIIGISFFSETFKTDLIKNIEPEMFFFGLGFLLLETRSVTALNLIWGATWLTSAIVFAAILVMVLLATIIMKKFNLSIYFCFFGLIFSLILVYLFPIEFVLKINLSVKILFSFCIIGAPIFFASLCFAKIFSNIESTNLAFGWNLLGSVCGGLLEFFSMVVGLKALLLFAAISYLFALLFFNRKDRGSTISHVLTY